MTGPDLDPETFSVGVGLSEPTAGMCAASGSVEVVLLAVTGVRDLSGIGESSGYPTGYGCEVCS